MRQFLALAILAATLVACKSTNNSGGYDYNRSHAAYGSDGAYKDPGPVQRTKNAFSNFMY